VLKVSGDNQASPQHVIVAAPLVVRVVDALGAPVGGISVAFSGSAGAYVTPATATTDAQGLASWTGFVHTAGTQSVVAVADNLAPAVFAVNVTPSGAPFDGRYLITYVTGDQGGTDTARVSGSDVYSEHVMEPLPYSSGFNQTTGTIDYKERAFIGNYWHLRGTLTLTPDGRVNGTGQYEYESFNVPNGRIGTWTAVRL